MADNTNFILPDNYLYISHLNDIDGKDFRFWKLPCYPETISDSMSSTFSPSTALGRTAPIYTYSNSGPRTVQVSFKVHRDQMNDVNLGVSNSELGIGEDYVDNLINALRAACLPKYNVSNRAIEPPLVAMKLGQEVFIKGVLTGGGGFTYGGVILENEKYSEVSFSLTIAEIDPYDATEVFKNGGFRGVVQTLKKGMNIE